MSVGSFFTCRSSESSNVRAVPSRRSTSSRVRSPTERRCRFGGVPGRPQVVAHEPDHRLSSSAGRDEQDGVELVHLDELHLDPLAARGRQVLPDVVGADRQLAVAAVDEHGELDARGPAVVEERLDRSADRAAGVEDVVDEHDRPPVEREVELRRADERLRCERRLAAADRHVVAVEGDVDCAERGLDSGALVDQAREPPRERYAAGLDPDERELVERRVALDDLVGDSRKGPRQPVGVEEALPLGRGVRVHPTPFRPRWTGLKGLVRGGL